MGTIMTRGELVMVNFMCHFDWAMRMLRPLAQLILDVSVKELLGE